MKTRYFIMTTTFSSNEYTQSTFPFYDNSFLDIFNAFAQALQIQLDST